MTTVTEKIKYIVYFAGKKAPYYEGPDSGGLYSFSYTPLCDGLKDSKSAAQRYSPSAFGASSVHTIKVTNTVYGAHLPFSVSRTSKNKWVASCSRCGLSSNGAKSTIAFALENIKGRAEGTICGVESYVDLGIT